MMSTMKMAGKMINNNYEQFVVVAETEWKFDYENFEPIQPEISACSCGRQNPNCACGRHIQLKTNPPRITKHSLRMGAIEWNIIFNDQTKTFEFTCQSVADGSVDAVHMEQTLVYLELNLDIEIGKGLPTVIKLSGPTTKNDYIYKPMISERHVFTSEANLLTCKLDLINIMCDNVFTVRILKHRSMFPDFTLESTVLGRMGTNGKLRVAGQVFYVNKQLLSMHSEYFDLMYNGPYVEANQEVVELKHEQADATVFHDFLLVMCVPEALPNPKNVAALVNLANMYQAENVRLKFKCHLSMCREMPVKERYALAGELGLEELQTSIKRNVSSFEQCIIDAVSKKAFAHAK